ncbi:MAG: hypothetical protein IJW64_04100 [Clostridia bacterium]|nr:hypothetical protein [Clostridia bacterium]
MIVTTQQLKEQYPNIADVKGKISRDIKKGKLFPLVKGVYETDANAHGSRLAQFIYGPSYLSFDYVLHYHGLIPEAVYNTYTCATFNKKKIKTYTNHFGTFVYRDVPKEVFSLGVFVFDEGNYSYQVASAEKALCDKLYTLSPVKSVKDFKILLFEDLRIDENEFNQLNKGDLLKLAPLYRSTNLNLLVKLIKERK